MNLSYLVACGLMVTLLSVRMGAKPVSQAQQKSLRGLLGEELAEFLESEEKERRLDAVRSRIRLLRDLRMDTRGPRGMWARLLNDQPAPRRHKSGNKKGGSTSRSGCFGHKMDRIGTISGMGC
ncbi:C-type natriuretic peptide [Spinachia spinachia]